MAPVRAAVGVEPMPHDEAVLLVLRPPLWQRLVCSISLLATATVLAIGGAADESAKAWAWLGAVGICVVVGRYWFVRIEASPSGLVLVNWVTRRRVAWPEIARVTYDMALRIQTTRGELGSAVFPYVPGALEVGRAPGRRAAKELHALLKRRRELARKERRAVKDRTRDGKEVS